MRYLTLLILLSACAQPSAGINWHLWTQALVDTGNMRTERVPEDAPVTRESLIENFRRIAFDLEEFPLGEDFPTHRQTEPPHLRKWREPIVYETYHIDEDGALVSDVVPSFMDRLASITGHPIDRNVTHPDSDEGTSLLILIGPDGLFQHFRLLTTMSEQDEQTLQAIHRLADFVDAWRVSASPCAGQVYESPGITPGTEDSAAPRGTIISGVVLIRREMPRALLKSCIEEELTQVMGLMNDDTEVRPSIFNDDEEFALLTLHDAALLRILYDERLKPGMSPEVAMPIVRQIVSEVWPPSGPLLEAAKHGAIPTSQTQAQGAPPNLSAKVTN